MKRKTVPNFLLAAFLWLCSLIVLYPLAMVVVTSFKTYGEANFLSINLPQHFMFENYVKVFNEGKIWQSFLNSTFITVFSVVIVVLLSAMLSYILMRRPTKLNNLIHKVLTFGIIAPFAALPTIQLLKAMNIYGSQISLVFVYAALFMPFSSILYCSFISTVPVEIDEAAVLDGCSGFNLFFRIVSPLLLPVTVTVAMLNFMWVWNDFQYPLYLLNSSTKWTLPLSVYSFFGTYNRSWHLVCADMVMVSLPVVIIYMFAQKYIVSGMTAGAVKG
jgi:raffinose/stachyose/melibiose transport system permease protein